MDKYYCSKCMLISDESSPCKQCGHIELKHIWITVQDQKAKYYVED
ncbi:RNA polymerase subunit RPABC4/transcription elongation factor Spt4 [Metabacillus crassostreae]|nr:RNA polymerase subunit RPABC4/transcription elongation factor Spt4 [Metabacillus crassostreae]